MSTWALDVHRAARVEAAHGGQVLITGATHDLVRSALPDGVSLRDMGEHRLRDLERPEHLYQIVVSGLNSDFAPLRTMSVRLDLLPRDLTSFVGRDNELAQATGLLRDTRLLTLTGPGGTGKTRLAVELARHMEANFRDGAAFVPLAPIRDPFWSVHDPSVPWTRRPTGDARHRDGNGADAHVASVARPRQLEQLLEFSATPGTTSRGNPIAQAPGDSRSPLRISGEQEFAVPR